MLLETNTSYINPYQIVKVTKSYKVENNEYEGCYAFDIILNNGDIETNVYKTFEACEHQLEKVLSIIDKAL